MRPRTLIIWAGVGFLGVTGGGKAAVTAVTSHAPAAHAHTDAVVTGPSETAFLTAVLKNMGAPVTRANLTSLTGWVERETRWPPVASYNALNSTLKEPGSTIYNNITLSGGTVIHVWNYPDAETGAAATAATITNGHYPHIVAALMVGTGLCDAPAAYQDFLTWSGGDYTTPLNCS